VSEKARRILFHPSHPSCSLAALARWYGEALIDARTKPRDTRRQMRGTGAGKNLGFFNILPRARRATPIPPNPR
jgi:hypothetical protein